MPSSKKFEYVDEKVYKAAIYVQDFIGPAVEEASKQLRLFTKGKCTLGLVEEGTKAPPGKKDIECYTLHLLREGHLPSPIQIASLWLLSDAEVALTPEYQIDYPNTSKIIETNASLQVKKGNFSWALKRLINSSRSIRLIAQAMPKKTKQRKEKP